MAKSVYSQFSYIIKLKKKTLELQLGPCEREEVVFLGRFHLNFLELPSTYRLSFFRLVDAESEVSGITQNSPTVFRIEVSGFTSHSLTLSMRKFHATHQLQQTLDPHAPHRDHNRPLKKSNFFSPSLPRSATFLHPSPLGRPPSTQSLSRSARSETRSNKFEVSKNFAPRFQQIRGLEFGAPRIQGIRGLEIRCDSVATNWKSRTRVPLDFNKFEVSNLLLLDSVLKLSEWRLPPGHPIPTVPKTLVVTGRADWVVRDRSRCVYKEASPSFSPALSLSLSRSRPAAAVSLLDFWNSLGVSALEALLRAICFRNSGRFEKSRVWSLWG
jgi:hypothetical protein